MDGGSSIDGDHNRDRDRDKDRGKNDGRIGSKFLFT
jgi:hypothetical protein